MWYVTDEISAGNELLEASSSSGCVGAGVVVRATRVRGRRRFTFCGIRVAGRGHQSLQLTYEASLACAARLFLAFTVQLSVILKLSCPIKLSLATLIKLSLATPNQRSLASSLKLSFASSLKPSTHSIVLAIQIARASGFSTRRRRRSRHSVGTPPLSRRRARRTFRR